MVVDGGSQQKICLSSNAFDLRYKIEKVCVSSTHQKNSGKYYRTTL